MKKNNKSLLSEIKRVKQLIEDYTYKYRTGLNRHKKNIYIELVYKTEFEMQSSVPNEIALGVYFKELQNCD
jgi:hypothetical protein